MIKKHILCCVPTKDRYTSTLPLTLSSIANQTLLPDEVIIFDDSEKIIDIRSNEVIKNTLMLFDCKGIKWKVIFGKHMGQHFSHQLSQELASDIVWRIDDDEVAEPNVLEILYKIIEKDQKIGAVAGLVLMPNAKQNSKCGDNHINYLNNNCQWYKWNGSKEVQHLYSSFLYRKGIASYELSLSKAAHREETIFTHRIYKKGFKLFVTSDAITWHLKNDIGGIRNYKNELFIHDEAVFNEIYNRWNGTLTVYLDCGKGDTVVFYSILPELKNKYKSITIATLHPDLFFDEKELNIVKLNEVHVAEDQFNIYKFMSDRCWDNSLQEAFRQMYE